MKTWTTKSGYTITRVLGGRCNAFLLSHAGRHLLVDTGRVSQRRRLMRNLARAGAGGLEALVLTHTHFDHAENAAFVRGLFGAKVIVHASEAEYLAGGMSPLPAGTVLPTRIMISLFAKRLEPRFAYEPCVPDIRADDGYSLRGFGFDAYLLHTPGHSRGSMSVIIDDEIALAGDAMFGVFPRSVFPPFADDAGKLVESWGRLLETKCQVFIPAHGCANGRALVERCYRRRKR